MTKTLGVMCCGCNRMMDTDGNPVKFEQGFHIQMFTFAWFESKDFADEFATLGGWRYEEGNLRCPDCVEKEKKEPPSLKRGGYLDLSAFHRGRI